MIKGQTIVFQLYLPCSRSVNFRSTHSTRANMAPASWSLGHFFQRKSEQFWKQNTIFYTQKIVGRHMKLYTVHRSFK